MGRSLNGVDISHLNYLFLFINFSLELLIKFTKLFIYFEVILTFAYI